MQAQELAAILEAILFVSGDAVSRLDLCEALDISAQTLDEGLRLLQSSYDTGPRGMRLWQYENRIQLRTKPEYAPYIEKLLQPVQKKSLSQAALETLSVIAYKQPVTRGDIESVRGVKCDYSVASLMQKGLIQEVGRKEALGRPILYGTTEAFLQHFGLMSLSHLPELPHEEIPTIDV